MSANILDALGAHIGVRQAESAEVDDILREVRKWWCVCHESRLLVDWLAFVDLRDGHDGTVESETE